MPMATYFHRSKYQDCCQERRTYTKQTAVTVPDFPTFSLSHHFPSLPLSIRLIEIDFTHLSSLQRTMPETGL
jgi:hypothetical protein